MKKNNFGWGSQMFVFLSTMALFYIAVAIWQEAGWGLYSILAVILMLPAFLLMNLGIEKLAEDIEKDLDTD